MIGEEEAKELLRDSLYVGVYLEGKLVSIGAAYIRLPEIWAIGDVYTRPSYRNLGLGTLITTELTKRAILGGAKSILKVEENNLPAVKVFTKAGYRIVARELSIEVLK
jgi:predicted GNAT family acetyltransferase